MRSPFPGMDPYLEDPGGWVGVHDGLIALIREQLNQRLGPDFIADAGTSVYVIAPDERRWVFPDVYVVETAASALALAARGAIPPPLRVRLTTPTTLSQPHILIRDRATRAVVTLIEVLSPINKAPATTQARQDYLRKRQETMASRTHWVEIDLLRAGERSAEVRSATLSPYYAARWRVGEPDLELWPIGLREPLPTIGVPLPAPQDEVALDLQAALDLLFERYRYAELVNYRETPPPPPLTSGDAQWVAERVLHWVTGPAGNGTGDRDAS